MPSPPLPPSPATTPASQPSHRNAIFEDYHRAHAHASTNEAAPQSPQLFVGGASTGDGRRPSIQFETYQSEATLSTASARPKPRKRMSSPPPPTTYETRVSFNTFDNRDATDFALTLQSKHKDYVYTPRSRTFLCGTDQNNYSEFALEWLLDELVDDGDEIVCLRVVGKDSKINSDASVEEGRYKTEAQQLLEQIKAKNKNDEKSVSLVLEFAVGHVQDTIQRMIRIYEPACLVVGTRGRSLGGIQGLLPGSVSKYCLQNSPVPVVVVRPSKKRDKKKQRRLANPSRSGYKDILEKSRMLHKSERNKMVEHPGGEASEKEAKAVAKAIGLESEFTGAFGGLSRKEKSTTDAKGEGSPLGRVISGRSDYTTDDLESPSPTGALSPDVQSSMDARSPEFERLESPAISDNDEDAEDGDEGRDLGGIRPL
ncbi:universal stress protein family domain protein [Lasallia pustulata]|uniref:Universal stress protein family domain protein n=1 Tax=Lasallia pustulata TaxID=136370 RepID=A0A1W5DEG9_9LECA|nr:universal stress protein family domain protein [Lasallia pustulata]